MQEVTIIFIVACLSINLLISLVLSAIKHTCVYNSLKDIVNAIQEDADKHDLKKLVMTIKPTNRWSGSIVPYLELHYGVPTEKDDGQQE